MYMAATILLALNESSSRVSALNVFCSIKDAQLGTLFEGALRTATGSGCGAAPGAPPRSTLASADTQSFDYALSPDPTLVTATYDRSATGWATSLLAGAGEGVGGPLA
jgi:hypothetical protein